jgi:hypothetical protein
MRKNTGIVPPQQTVCDHQSEGRGMLPVLGDATIIFILIVALILRLAFLTGPVGSDDTNYFHYAQRLLHGEGFDTLHHHGGRLFFLTLIGVPAAFFGSVNAGAILGVLLMTIRDLVVVVYLRRWVGSVATVAGAGILAFNALSSTCAGLMEPDGLLSLLMFVSAALAFESTSAIGKKHFFLLIGSGFFAWAAYSSKETGILILPCVMIFLSMTDARWKIPAIRLGIFDASVFFATFIAFTMFDMFIYHLLSGDALYRVHAVALTHNTIGDVSEATSIIDFLRHGYWNLYNSLSWQKSSMTVLLLTAAILPLSLLKRAFSPFFALTGIFLAAFLIFGSSSLTRLIPLPVQDRYFEIIIPFLAVVIAGLVAFTGKKLKSCKREFILSLCVSFFMVIVSVPSVAVNAGRSTSFTSLGKNAAIAIRAVKHADPGRTIYVSSRLHWILESFMSREEFSELKIIPEKGNLPGGFYLLHPEADVKNQSLQVNKILSMPVYIIVSERQYTFSHYISGLKNFSSTVRYFDGQPGSVGVDAQLPQAADSVDRPHESGAPIFNVKTVRRNK